MAAGDIPFEKLPDIVLGRDRVYPRAEAMALLAASSHPQREALLAQVLENREDERQYRVVAAITLGRIFTPTAEALLTRNLHADEPTLSEVLKSLGRIGGREALAAIDSLKLSGEHPASGAAGFAAALISYRLGLAGHDLPQPKESDLLHPAAADARAIELEKMKAEPARLVIEALKRYPYGVEFEPDAVTLVQCAGEVNVICINREFSARGTLIDATRRKALFAVGALQSPETGDFSPSYLLLTSPSGTKGTVDMIVTRCSGAYAMAGVGRLAGDHGEFELRAVRRPGARAMVVRGTLVDGIVRAAEAMSSTTREPPRTVRRVVVNPTEDARRSGP
jgi:hypothetical protein